MNELAIGHQGALKFRVEGTLCNPQGTIDYVTVTAELQGLLASKNVYDFDGWSGLPFFFEELALNWRGWDGDKTFDSLEGDFRLSAKHDGHVRVTFELRDSDCPTPWTATGELSLDPGEELAAAAESLRGLLAISKA